MNVGETTECVISTGGVQELYTTTKNPRRGRREETKWEGVQGEDSMSPGPRTAGECVKAGDDRCFCQRSNSRRFVGAVQMPPPPPPLPPCPLIPPSLLPLDRRGMWG
ncbi:hypothetical protein JOB18_005082 [Solea senegalensis]|uniref:Uncharacterized protein n=1 Tax=Solea senegalensis TaxID=28829 RepID=A0AAV6Q9I2_SOLSE|nr:hypothetical protein JOB18_005082 [Solea senegalensis]